MRARVLNGDIVIDLINTPEEVAAAAQAASALGYNIRMVQSEDPNFQGMSSLFDHSDDDRWLEHDIQSRIVLLAVVKNVDPGTIIDEAKRDLMKQNLLGQNARQAVTSATRG